MRRVPRQIIPGAWGLQRYAGDQVVLGHFKASLERIPLVYERAPAQAQNDCLPWICGIQGWPVLTWQGEGIVQRVL